MADDEGGGGPEERVYVLEEKRVNFTYPLIIFASMAEDIRFDTMDLSVTACEKYVADYGIAAREIKLQMDKRYQPSWNVVVGEAYGFEIQYESKYFIYFYVLGTLALLIWKC